MMRALIKIIGKKLPANKTLDIAAKFTKPITQMRLDGKKKKERHSW